MSKNEMVEGFPCITPPKENCSGYLMAKQARKSFPAQTWYRATRTLELIHGDLCGPMTPATPSGKKYFLLLVDDYSRYMWVYMLREKGEAFDAFKRFRTLVEKGSAEIKTFRTDRGGEFCSKNFNSYCEENGIQREYTTPYTPQQNGVVERRNRTVVAMTRSFLKCMDLPVFLWGEEVRHSVYILNHLSTRALSTQTPHEVLTGEKPNLGHIRIFGCIAHIEITAVLT